MLTAPDYAVLLAGLVATLAIGGTFTRRQTDTQQFFLAGRHIPWWAVLLSFLATEVSALTIIGVPGTAFREDWGYLQFFLGSSAAKVVVALPIVWTNVLQALLFVAAGVAALLFVLSQVDGGAARAWELAGAAGRLRVWNPGPGLDDPGLVRAWLKEPNIWGVALLNGFVGSLAAFGTDHDLMQRLLSVETRKDSQRTLLLSPFITGALLLVYLSLGSALFAYAAQHPQWVVTRPDDVFPQFVGEVMPAGLRGLVLTAIVLASLDSPLGALSASFVTDIYRPLLAPGRKEAHYLAVSRAAVLVFGVVLALLALAFARFDGILWLAFKITGVTFGSLLGVFLLALLRRRPPLVDAGNVVAMVVMALLNLLLLYLSETGRLPLAWSWLVALGTIGTAGLAVAIGSVAR